jgi:3-oxoacyl-[acyl-carrier-protein] synthase-3
MAFIRAISYYLPERLLDNFELSSIFPEWSIDKISSKVGITSRHLASEDETAGDLAVKAAESLFSEYGIERESVDFVLLCTQSPDYLLPTTACIIQDRLRIPQSAGALDFNLGCSGFVYGLALAKGLIAGAMAHNVLLLTAETYSKYLHPSDKGNRSIFGDGAAACLVSETGFAQIGEFVLGTDGSGYDKLIVRDGGARHREKNGKVVQDESGSEMRDDFLYMNGGDIFNFTLKVIPELEKQVLQKNGLEEKDVDYFVFHQANKLMLETVRKVCSIAPERFYLNMEQVGNTVSSTIPIALKDCMDNGTVSSGMTVMIAGFGVGLSWGGTVLKWL